MNTNPWSNSIDVTAPSSHVVQLPALIGTPSFAVSWAGTDIGSGIQYYSIYVSDNGGSYTEWQTNTTSTGATYSGVVGHKYSFYSLATDNVNNVETAKTSADTTVQVVPIVATSTSLAASTNPANLGASATFTASVTPASGNVVPTGTVVFNDGSAQLGTGTLTASGQATYSTSSLAAGSHAITAVYGGDSLYTGSTSTTLTEVVNAPGFTLSIAPNSITMSQGQSGQATITIEPVGGFNSAITLSCSGLPANATCTFSPASVTPNGNNAAVTSTLIIETNVKTASAVKEPFPTPLREGALALILLGLPGVRLALRKKIRGKNLLTLLLALGLVAVCMNGCGGGGLRTPKGTSTVTVTANAGKATLTGTFSMTVQ
jgi:hypothetical protein